MDMIQKFGLTDAKTVSTPADLNAKLRKDDSVSKQVNSVKYQSIVGILLYSAITTRPDIAQTVGAESKFNVNPTEAHLTAGKRILKYLKGTINLAI